MQNWLFSCVEWWKLVCVIWLSEGLEFDTLVSVQRMGVYYIRHRQVEEIYFLKVRRESGGSGYYLICV